MSEPKNIHDGLRRLQALVTSIEIDLSNYLDAPQDYTAEYFQDVLAAASDAKNLIGYVRSKLKGE